MKQCDFCGNTEVKERNFLAVNKVSEISTRSDVIHEKRCSKCGNLLYARITKE